ncbi:GDSL-type esterase/lipase family protein [Streptomyces sp. MS2A]|nr:GDSL-type esterase/lipase family protein [Streptomyces sp. MS2A]
MRGSPRRVRARALRVIRRLSTVLLTGGALAGLLLGMVAQLAAPVDLTRPIGRAWSAAQEELGTARTPETCVSRGSECSQRFDHGWVYWSRGTGAHAVHDGALGTAFAEAGAEHAFGLPVDDVQRGADRSLRWQEFQRGGLFVRGGDAVTAVRGPMWGAWLRHREDRGGLGEPRSGVRRDANGVGIQEFRRGSIYLRDGVAVAVREDIARAYADSGAQQGPLGYPRLPEEAAGDGRVQRFEHGAIWWSEATGAVPVLDGMRGDYLRRGAQEGDLGWPTAAETAVKGGARQTFQNGVLYRADEDGAVHATWPGDIEARYRELGDAGGALGLPVGERTAFADAWYQAFSGGVLLSSPRGTSVLDRTTFDQWTRLPDRFGWPVKDAWSDERGSHTAFERVETIQRDGILYSAEPVGPQTAVLLCDSQCDGSSWVEQGARANGFTDIVERSYGGGGYVAHSGALGMSVTDALDSHLVLLPEGNPGLVSITLGGNDATQGVPGDQIVAAERRLLEQVRAAYPEATIVVNGVMSRRDASHAERRAAEALILPEAQAMGFPTISVAGWITDRRAPQADPIHLSQAGHDRVAGPYADALRAVLGR